jgi:drug/metabolite transporter (DMT)-like permease
MIDALVASLLGLATALGFGIAAVLTRVASSEGTDVKLASAVTMIAQLPVALVLLASGFPQIPDAGTVGIALAASFAGLAGTMMMVTALRAGIVALVAPFAGMSGILVALYGLAVEPAPSLGILAGLAVAACGAILALRPRYRGNRWPVLLGLGSAAVFALADLLGLAAAERAGGSFTGAGTVLLVSSGMGLGIMLGRRSHLAGLSHVGTFALAGLAQSVGLALLLAGLQLSITAAGLASSQWALVGVIVSWIALREKLQPHQKLAVCLALAGIAIVAAQASAS